MEKRMSPSQVRTYSRHYDHQTSDDADFFEMVQKIPTLTKMGAVCLVVGKFMGIMAITVAFIPALNLLVVPLVVAWGGFVFISIVLCSTDHFRRKKLAENKEKLAAVTDITAEIPELQEQLLQELKEQENVESAVIIPLAVGQS